MVGAGDVLAQTVPATLTTDDILIQVMPSGTEGKGSVTTATEGSVSAAVDATTREVTLTVTPGTGYKTRKDLIVVEKMVNPLRSNAPRRAPGTGTFDITSGPDGWVTAATTETYTFTVPTDYDGANVIVTFVSATSAATQITSLEQITDLSGDYVLVSDIYASGGVVGEFTGTLDGNYHKIYNLGAPLFSSVNGGTVKNITFEDVNISTDGDAGTVTPLAKGAARIYNCGILSSSTDYDKDGNITGFTGSSVSGSGNVGSIVGTLDETARVINCYSYANITGGSNKGGIVGYNNYASKYTDIRTMVMNCMFYGDISTGGTISPIYGGLEISNDYTTNNTNRLNNYNYFLYEAPFSRNNTTTNPIISKYNCALAAEERFLVRFEFYRNLLNSTRELAAWYATGNATNGKGIGDANKMAKWVLDKSIAPYPILKVQGKYPSVVNYDPEYTYDETGSKVLRTSVSERNHGKNLGELTVNISIGSGSPEGASIKTGMSRITLQRTDKDTLNYNFNYDKVQLPYYNDVGIGNYTHNKVVTGWKVTVSGGSTSFTTSNYDAPNYNFADRDCTGKDNFTTSGRIYSQGGYFNVPTGVTSITIEPYWGKAAYLSDACYDRYGYNNTDNLTQVGGGQRYTNGDTYSINGSEQKVYTTAANALAALTGVSNPTVYDYAIVLVGNYHHHAKEGKEGPEISSDTKPFTIMSIDLNEDDEPDYSLIYRSGKNQLMAPIRFDFITVPGMAMAHKMAQTSKASKDRDLGIPGNCKPRGWFEITTTGLIRYGQFEHSYDGKSLAPVIFMGGVIDQFVANNTQNAGTSEAYNNKTRYMLFGDNVWFKMLSNGTHMDNSAATPHRPISLTGGEYEKLYLSGYFKPTANACTTSGGDNNAECYIDGGKFGEVAGAGQEDISGNVTWLINHADIKSFYGGGIKASDHEQITGEINTTIKNSHVSLFCGGPKFGDMVAGKTVTTNATDCVFGTYFGAGYGGTSIYRQYVKNEYQLKNYDWNSWVSSSYDNSAGDNYRGKFYSGRGVSCGYEYEFFGGSGGNVARLYIRYASFSLAQTNNVTSNLTGCEVTGNFYGGGSLGKVRGNATSTLDGCTVHGSAFGAGYSATMPPVSIMKTGGFTVNGDATNPNYNETTGVYETADFPALEDFNWTHVTSLKNKAQAVDGTSVKTLADLTGLGTVVGTATLTINNTTVGESIYGGGEESGVDGNTSVTVNGATVGVGSTGKFGYRWGNVYGGGKGKIKIQNDGSSVLAVENIADLDAGVVKGNTNVTINGTAETTQILHNVYGGGSVGSVGTFTRDATSGMPTACADNTGLATVTINGGKIGHDHQDTGMVNGSSRGWEGDPNGEGAFAFLNQLAWVNNAIVTIGNATSGDDDHGPTIMGSVYGGGENGHNYENAQVTVHKGTIGFEEGAWDCGNIYGAGCGTDTFSRDDNGNGEIEEDEKGHHNPMAGLVRGNTTITVNGGHVVRNVYGGGSMGSVGVDSEPSSGSATITVNAGVIGTVGSNYGNVFGGPKGNSNDTEVIASVRNSQVNINTGADVKGSVFGGGDAGDVKENTIVNMAGGTVGKNIYGGGNLGYVGKITISPDFRSFTWKDKNGNDNSVGNADNTGVSTVTITGGTVGSNSTVSNEQGSVFGGGKGSDATFWCEKGMVYTTNVTINNATVNSHVYGGGEIARVESDTRVTIGVENASGEGFAPDIKGNVFGAGKGLDTHGYSALVRGNTRVFLQGKAKIGQNVYGGGEIASVGKYSLNNKNMPVSLVSDGLGICRVTVRDNVQIGPDNTGSVFGGGKGIVPVWDANNKPQRMTIVNGQSDWETFATENDYLTFVQTLALATQTYVTIGGTRDESTDAITLAGAPTVKGSVYGGSESGFVQHNTFVTVEGGQIGAAGTEGNVYGGGLGLPTFAEAGSVSENTTLDINGGTMYGSVYGGGAYGFVKGGVAVNINGGTIKKDVYGGGALADTNTSNWNAAANNGAGNWAEQHTAATHTTTVNLKGGIIGGDAYGGGLGRLASGTEGQPGYVAPIAAMVYGNVSVNQGTANIDEAPATAYTTTYLTDDNSNQVVNSGRIFGCNNLNGSPKGNVTVTVNRTVTGKDGEGNNIVRTAITRDETTKEVLSVATPHTYEVAAVYGGGNLADYTPAEGKVQVIINSCDISIEEVYGGGNAAKVPSTDVTVNGAHEIEQLFGGGNGKDKYTLDGGTTWNENPGADIDGYANTLIKGGYVHEAYGGSNEKGTITGSITIDLGTGELAACPVKVDKLVGAGKNADVNGDLIMIMGCKDATKVPLVYGGADNANVKGDVELTITSGNFGKVFGGNNLGGAIFGHIYLNIEETSDCEPIRIDELYLGGNQATYSKYGYYQPIDPLTHQPQLDANDRPVYKARTSATDEHKPIKRDGTEYATIDDFTPYEEPELNVISCTSIGEVFGGGYGLGGDMYANPTVNLNMIPGYHAETVLGGAHKLGAIGNVYGGGNEANVVGNTTINIGTETSVRVKSWNYNATTQTYTTENRPVEGANITGNVYGGGKLADVGMTHLQTVGAATNDVIDFVGNTNVNIGTRYNTLTQKWDAVPEGDAKVLIAGHVFGGGKGEAKSEGEGAFRCGKAMVTGGTNVHIGNGTVGTLENGSLKAGTGNVYGGGEVGRVEGNTVVMVGAESGTSEPLIQGEVYGAGKGVSTHGYSALVRGNTDVTVQGDAKVKESVYGGGEIGSVGRYNIATPADLAAHPDVLVGMPFSLQDNGSGYCTVVVRGNAEVGPDGMSMTKAGGPDDTGYVFGGGKGVLPYEGYTYPATGEDAPWRVLPANTKEFFSEEKYDEYYPTGRDQHDHEVDYFRFVESLALTTQTDVTIGGNAFIKGSVYGGSFNGHVQHDTHVTIEGDCQIGQGEGITERYSQHYGSWPTDTEDITTSWAECSHWTYLESDGAPFDMYAKYSKTEDGKVKWYYDAAFTQYAGGGSHIAKDGHTYYGNVFGGGSGSIPYAPGKWHRGAGSVGGNCQVDITGGHILTSVYGGNELTDVGAYVKDNHGQNTTTPVATPEGKCVVNMTGGTVGVPRTKDDMKAHPVTCYVFGAGKGDQRAFFATWTNVVETEVNISGDARIYGSVFGGGEDGHVMYNAKTNIGTVTIGGTSHSVTDDLIIGTTGTSYVDGNVFGGGRGFGGEVQTAGTVGGDVEVNISGGKMLGSVYGGGRLASVGTQFTTPDAENYGNFQDDGNGRTYGHVTVNISGGTIGNSTGNKESGNVFGGSMGRLTLLNGTLNPIWPRMAQVKYTAVNVYGDAVIKRNVYGGSELGTVQREAYVTIGGYKTGDADTDGNVPVTSSGSPTVRRNVFGGGYGSEDDDTHTIFTVDEPIDYNNPGGGYETNTYAFTPMQFAGCVGQNTYVNVVGGYVRKSVYGGGEMASVGIINCRAESSATDPSSDKSKVMVGQQGGQYYYYKNMINHWDVDSEFALSWPFEFQYIPGFNGNTYVNVTGGRLGVKTGSDTADFGTNDDDKDNGDVYGGGQGKAGNYKDYVFCGNVGSAHVKIGYSTTIEPNNYEVDGDCVAGAVYAGGENGHVTGDAKLTLTGGLVGHSIYGGGSGKGKFDKDLLKIGAPANSTDPYDMITRRIYSITAGKVFGNTEIEMTGGTVVRNVYGGGNMGSVGKGNYAGGPDDYSTAGYGEKLPTGTNLWDDNNKFSTAFLHSGKCTVTITGGTIGYIDQTNPTKSQKDGLPYGNVFGGCRGESAPNLRESPRYYYSPEFFLGYANETEVTIGAEGETGPRIYGSVYGGGQDGHIRRDTYVKIYSGRIGSDYTSGKFAIVGTSDVNNLQWLHRGNVYGAGSGIGKYKFDFNNDGQYTSTHIQYGVKTGTNEPNYVDEEDYSTSAGSVTGSTKVEIKGGTIYRNVYGGGSLSTIGAPKIGQPTYMYSKKDTSHSSEIGKQTLNEVIISGGHIGGDYSYDAQGQHVYGGHVFGASRGQADLDASTFSTSMFTDVSINPNTSDATKSPLIHGSVFGGGEIGIVKGDVAVYMTGGQVNKDVYGGGALAHTQTANWNATANSGAGDWADAKKSALYTTTLRMTGGRIVGEAYGGGLGEKTGVNGATSDIEALVYGDVLVDLNGTTTMNTSTGKPTTNGTKTTNTKGCVVHHVFGCNNVNGSPQGDVMVHVYATQNKNTASILSKVPLTFTEPATGKVDYWSTQVTNIGLTPATVIGDASTDDEKIERLKAAIEANRYDVEAVYGGGDQAAYIPVTPWDGTTGFKSHVIIEGCAETSIETVYGGGNAAPVPETNVDIRAAYEIQAVFGGGNGKDKIIINNVETPNPGADVGQYKNASNETVTYGTGEVNLNLKGGRIHEAYGGSNEKGMIKGKVSIDTDPEGDCDLIVEKLVGAGKNADIDGDLILILGCKPTTKTPLIFAGADNADVNGNVELTITSGTFGKVFGGNNLGGAIKGHLVLNIEETGCTPINIDELYLGGYEAPYSIYGYYQPIDPATNLPQVDANEKPVLLPRTAADHAITDTSNPNYKAPYGNPANTDGKHPFPYAEPVLNVVSATHIGKVFGGGLGEKAVMHADPIVNINMIKGTPNGVTASSIGTIGDVYGGGNEAAVVGNTTVNIATATTVQLHELIKPDGEYQMSDPITVEGADITGNVYGGGNEAAVKANTTVNIGGGTISGNVYGGGSLGDVGTITSQPNSTGGTDYIWETGTGVSNVVMTGGTVGPDGMNPTTDKNTGNVFGAGKGEADSFECNKAMVSTTNVTINNGTVRGSVYGGGEIGRVEHNSMVTIGEAGTETSVPDIKGNVFGGGAGVKTHGYSALIRGNSTVTVQGKAKVGLNVYGGGEIASVGKYKVKKAQGDPDDAPDELPIGMPYSLVSDNLGISTVTVQDGAEITGDVFGAGKGQVPEDLDWTTIAGDKTQMPKRMMNDYPQKNTYWDWYDESRGIIWEYFDTEAKYHEFIETLALTTQTFVNVGGNAKVKGDVYGGSESGFVQHHTDVTIQGSSEIGTTGANATGGDIFGGGLGLATYAEAGRVSGDTKLHINGGTMHGSVYGGGAYGLVKKNVTVDIAGGEVDNDVYGGGALANTNTANPDGVTNQYVTAVNLKSGTVHGAAYGGALGQKTGVNGATSDIAAIVYGDVTVELNKKIENAYGTCRINNIFGCNNINGTPKGHALVHVFKTTPWEGQAANGYDMTAVYGGGNASDYEPIDAQQSTEVIIEGCDLTSIEQVYGGGYGAASPATNVLIRGTKIIDKVFGGGYGAGDNNPGANVGFKTGTPTTAYTTGTGKAIVQLMGGTIHYVYGGSNTKGDIRGGSNVTKVNSDGLAGCCDYLHVDEIYGGGKNADMYGGTEIVLGCMPDDWVGAIYAGAEKADVMNDVSLTLTSGKFGRVFGGNKSGGKIEGSITINLEENPECDTPLIIGEVYGGGNQAAYSAYGYKKDTSTGNWTPLQKGDPDATFDFSGPWVCAKAFTSVGNIYGGGYGETATVIGNPTVLISVVKDGTDQMSATGIANRNYAGEVKELPQGTDGKVYVQLHPHVAGEMGVIGNVFGGGNAAKVIGNTSIGIGLNDPGLPEGAKARVRFESLVDDPTTTDVDESIKTVAGADIRGNIYGGGNQAEVTGDTNVQIGKSE